VPGTLSYFVETGLEIRRICRDGTAMTFVSE
jgi:hypothetical protein